MQSRKNFEFKSLPNVPAIVNAIEVYQRHGYRVLLGTPDSLVTRLEKEGRLVDASAGLSLSDVFVFQLIAAVAPW